MQQMNKKILVVIPCILLLDANLFHEIKKGD